ncbi:hypothetical protein LS73_008740 [Helicobacter muridarum]|uniref:Uncharacterized protein n=1 Tax=Helicobacter muridarum TaxID=216 RepID=A0A099TXC0_9HELI|nr:hypothetical protein [Helicobacter muridarum]TLD98503.1 hypothetical protein LS73_008740 [Helicobacter muridarum]STQ86802.1 Uncharacterised protein [Helicobacter muridarum]
MKKVWIYFSAVFALFMLFFSYAYPIVPFWGDDWQMISAYGSLRPANSWIPARVLPPFIQTAMGVVSAYVVMPLSGLDFVDAITLTSAITLSIVFTALSYVIYRLMLTITQNLSLALFITSVFIMGGFCATRAQVMPLFLPADVQAEGMGYIFTLISFYIIPNVLNLSLLCGLFCYQYTYLCKRKFYTKEMWLLAGVGAIILYLAQFSITSASLILSSYCGASLFVELYYFFKFHKNKISFSAYIRDNYTYFYGLLFCVTLWCIAAICDINSGRAQACGDFNLVFGASYTYSNLKFMRIGFYILFALVFIGIVIKAYKDKTLRKFISIQILWLICLISAYTLIVSKCGAKYYLMSGLLICILWVMCVWIAIIFKDSKKLLSILGFMAFLAFLHPFEPYKERPREAYLFYKEYAKSWVETAQRASQNGLDSVTIKVPRDFEHWKWNGWFFDGFARTLKNYGIIQKPIKVKFEPDS